MPYYDFECQDCEKQVQRNVTIAEKEAGQIGLCPECGSSRLEQVFAGVALAGKLGEPQRKSAPGGSCGHSCACYPQ